VFFCGDPQWEYSNEKNGQPRELAFTEAQSDLFFQFIFDSEFKNINANITVFDEHRNLNSEAKSNICQVPALALQGFIDVVKLRTDLKSVQSFFSNGCERALFHNLFSFRI
jgi:hypothetical protein